MICDKKEILQYLHKYPVKSWSVKEKTKRQLKSFC